MPETHFYSVSLVHKIEKRIGPKCYRNIEFWSGGCSFVKSPKTKIDQENVKTTTYRY